MTGRVGAATEAEPWRVVFVRHGQPRGAEHDPELTTAGHRMVADAAVWAAGLGWPLARVLHTPTQRTAQTAEAVAVAVGAPCLVVDDEPLSIDAWEQMLDAQRGRHPFGDRALPRPALPALVYVGHHTTLRMLVQQCAAGAVPPINDRAWAAGLALTRTAGRWGLVRAWPGVCPS